MGQDGFRRKRLKNISYFSYCKVIIQVLYMIEYLGIIIIIYIYI